MSGPYISVVVPTIDRPELLAKCLRGVLSGDFDDLEAIIVDQSRDDRTARLVREQFGSDPRVRYVHSKVSGAARARNLGADQATGTILAFIDDDAVPAAGWLAAYAAAFREIRPEPGMVGGRITAMWETPCPAWLSAPMLHLVGAYDAGDRVRPFPAGDFPMSGNFALPRALMRELGGFDTRLGFDVRRSTPLLAGEDSHLALKVLRSGRPLYYHPGAEVHHLVRGDKLSRRYVLRRLYWNGRTYLQLRRREDGDRRAWIEVLRDARAKRAGGAPRTVTPGRGGSAMFMLVAAMSAFTAGVAVEAAAGLGARPAQGGRESRG